MVTCDNLICKEGEHGSTEVEVPTQVNIELGLANRGWVVIKEGVVTGDFCTKWCYAACVSRWAGIADVPPVSVLADYKNG